MNDFLHSLRNGQADKQRAPKTRKNYDNSYQYNNNPKFHSYGNGYQNPRNPNMKRPPMPSGPIGNQLPPEDPGMTLLADAIENLTNHVEILIKNQEYLTTVQERTADMMERQAYAIERIAAHMSMEAPPRSDAAPKYDVRDEPVQEEKKDLPNTPEPYQEEADMKPPAAGQAGQTGETDFFPENILTPADPEKKTKRRVIRKRKKPVAAKKENEKASSGTTLLPRDEVMDMIHTMRKQGATYDQIAKHLVGLGQPTFSGRGEWHAQTIHRLCSKK